MKTITKTLLVAAVLAVAAKAHGQPANDDYAYRWQESHLPSGFGVATILGGGVTGFTDTGARNLTSSVGGLWDLRVTLGSHDTFALDFDYVGTADSIKMPAGSQSETLVGTNFNAALRYNVYPAFLLTPYVFAGAGYQHYNVTGTTMAPGLNDSATLAVFPLGGGFAYRNSGLVIDVRATLRLAASSDLIIADVAGTSQSLHTWEAAAGAGYEF